MSFEDDIRRDLDVFVNDADFAIQALINGEYVRGIFDPGLMDDREPRSPHFHCKDSDLKPVSHGDPVLIDWTPYDVTQTGVITYWVEGYQPDGTGLATLVLKEESQVSPIFIIDIDNTRHGHAVDAPDVFVSQFPLNVEGLRHGHRLDEPELLDLRVAIDASNDQVNKTGNVVSSIIAVDGRAYSVQGGAGVTHGINLSPGLQLVYAFDGSSGSYFKAGSSPVLPQPFTAFVVARRGSAGDQIVFDNQ